MCTKEIMLMGKRYIVLSDGSKVMISRVCEPFGKTLALEFSPIGCKGYHHDIKSGKSFAKGKWFYQYKGHKQDVSKCVAGPLSFKHQKEVKGYEHEDVEKLSYAKQHIWIEVAGEKITLEHRKVRYDLPGIPYHFHEDRVSNSQGRLPYFEGCYQFFPQDKFKVFKRCDDTEYLSFLAPSVEKKSANLCQVRQEQKRCREYIIDLPLGSNRDGGYIWFSHSIITEDEDLPTVNIWQELRLDDVSSAQRGHKFVWLYHHMYGTWLMPNGTHFFGI